MNLSRSGGIRPQAIIELPWTTLEGTVLASGDGWWEAYTSDTNFDRAEYEPFSTYRAAWEYMVHTLRLRARDYRVVCVDEIAI